MIFSVEEIKNWLKKQHTIAQALVNLTDESIINCNDYPTSLNYPRTKENLEKYETQIGLLQLREEQLLLRRNGQQGKYWMALSPRWIDEPAKKRLSTDYEIGYWVNYGDDETYGFFSVESIKKWLTTPDVKLHTLGGTKER